MSPPASTAMLFWAASVLPWTAMSLLAIRLTVLPDRLLAMERVSSRLSRLVLVFLDKKSRLVAWRASLQFWLDSPDSMRRSRPALA